MNETILTVENLTKYYGKLAAVRDLSFSLQEHEVVGLLGPNGAGKTTTIQMLLGLLEPSSGTIMVRGKSLATHRTEVLGMMNFAATYASLPGNLAVEENLKFFSRLYNVPNRKQRISELLDRFQLRSMKRMRTGLLSSGEQTRLTLAKAFLNRPRLLLLDEPTASLDPDTAAQMRQEIIEQARQSQTAILWTSHNMFEMERMCDRIIFLSHGKILAEGSPAELIKQFKQTNLEDTFIVLARSQPV